MTGLALFVRSRQVPAVLASLIVLAALGRVVGTGAFRVGSTEPLNVPFATLLPLLQAGVVGSIVVTVQATAERLAARGVVTFQLVVLAVALGLALASNLWSAAELAGPSTALSCNRNLLGYLGLTLMSARLLGAGLLWVGPLLTAVTALTLGGFSGRGRIWAWVIQPDGDRVALAVAIILLGAGVVAARRIIER